MRSPDWQSPAECGKAPIGSQSVTTWVRHAGLQAQTLPNCSSELRHGREMLISQRIPAYGDSFYASPRLFQQSVFER